MENEVNNAEVNNANEVKPENEKGKVQVKRITYVAGYRHETEVMSILHQKKLREHLKSICVDVQADTKTGITKFMFFGYKSYSQVLDAEAKLQKAIKGIEFEFVEANPNN